MLGRMMLMGCLGLSLAPLIAAGQNDSRLAQQLDSLVQSHSGEVAIAIRHLASGEQYQYRSEVVQPTASLIKLAILVEAYRQAEAGQLDLDQSIVLREEDKVPGSGILTPHFSAGATLSLRDLVRLMIAYSDNTATNLVLDRVGLESTNATMRDWGYPETQVHSLVFRRDSSLAPERSRLYGLGSTTAAETVGLLTDLVNHRGLSAESCRQVLEHLRACNDDRKLSRFLPEDAVLAHKTGAVSSSRCDAGVLETPSGPVAICVLTTANQDRSWGESNAAEILCGRVGRIVYRRFGDSASARPDRPLQRGDNGVLVEDLQRTLNLRLQPSPQLAVDGDFGPQTQAAVIRFQETRELPEQHGRVDTTTWQALGRLVGEGAAVDLPPLPPRLPGDGTRADERPVVTCRSWAIIDGESGELLFGEAADTARPQASTTKIMTAWLVLQAIEREPALADRLVTFSRRADDTLGSSSTIRAGEQIAVRQLLYGLLLPSGNDAAVALAECCGTHFSVPGEFEDPVARFVAAMNREAEALGLANTSFRNPHGLTEQDHHSSAVDLARLARVALLHPRFQQVVNTRRHVVSVTGAAGYERQLVWRNTNRLLGIEGYDGVKTGTTSAAGACLVASTRGADRHLILTLLGSASSEARYSDARNLLRWAWARLDRSPSTPTGDAASGNLGLSLPADPPR